MAVKSLSYARELERLLAGGMSFEEANKIAIERAEVGRQPVEKKKSWYEPLKKRFIKLYKKVRKNVSHSKGNA